MNDFSEIDEYLDNCNKYEELLTDNFLQFDKTQTNKILENLNTYLEFYNTNYKFYECELRSVSIESVPDHYKNAKTRHFNNLEKFAKQLKQYNINVGNNIDFYDVIIDNAEKYDTKQLIYTGDQIQNVIVKSLECQVKWIGQTKDIAIETIAELDRQEQKLLFISDNVHDIKSELKNSYKYLRVIVRNLCKDWIFRFLCLLVILALIVSIILLIVIPNHSILNHVNLPLNSTNILNSTSV